MPLSSEPPWFDLTTPGAVKSRLSEFWPEMGSSARAVAGIVELRTASSVCSSAAGEEETSTVDPTDPTERTKSRPTSAPTVTVAGVSFLPKPDATADTT